MKKYNKAEVFTSLSLKRELKARMDLAIVKIGKKMTYTDLIGYLLNLIEQK